MLNAIIKLRGQISLLKQIPSHMATRLNPYTARGLISPKSARTIKQQNAKSSLLLDPSDIMSHFCTLDQDSVAQSLPRDPKYSECLRSSDPPLPPGPSPMSELPRGGGGCTASPLPLYCQDTCCPVVPLICTFEGLCPLRLPIIVPYVGHSLWPSLPFPSLLYKASTSTPCWPLWHKASTWHI